MGLVHSAALSSRCHSSICRGIGLIDDQRFGGQHAGGDGSGIFQRGTGDLGGVYDACGNHIHIFTGVGVLS